MIATLPTLKTRRQIAAEMDELKNQWQLATFHRDREMADETLEALLELGDDASRAGFLEMVANIDNLIGVFETAFARLF